MTSEPRSSHDCFRPPVCVIEVGHPAETPAEWRSSTQPELTVCTRHKEHYETAYDDYSHLAPWLPIDGLPMADLCTMCEQRPATTTWGFPVCQPCADGLIGLHADLREMERTDPELRALVERQDRDAWRADLKRRVAARLVADTTDDEFGITLDPCEHPSINGGICAVCGMTTNDGWGSDVQAR